MVRLIVDLADATREQHPMHMHIKLTFDLSSVTS